MADDDDERRARDAGLIIPSVPSVEPMRRWQLADLQIETNGTPAQIMAPHQRKPGNGWTPGALAVFVGVGVELDKRDQIIAQLEQRLADLRRDFDQLVENLTALETYCVLCQGPCAHGSDAAGVKSIHDEARRRAKKNAQRIEIDPEEAERDYRERLQRVQIFFTRNPDARETAIAATGVTSLIEVPSLKDLRELEQWLNRHGGVEWH